MAMFILRLCGTLLARSPTLNREGKPQIRNLYTILMKIKDIKDIAEVPALSYDRSLAMRAQLKTVEELAQRMRQRLRTCISLDADDGGETSLDVLGAMQGEKREVVRGILLGACITALQEDITALQLLAKDLEAQITDLYSMVTVEQALNSNPFRNSLKKDK